MQGRRVLVVCNLKPAKMRDVMSYGMVREGRGSQGLQGRPQLTRDEGADKRVEKRAYWEKGLTADLWRVAMFFPQSRPLTVPPH